MTATFLDTKSCRSPKLLALAAKAGRLALTLLALALLGLLIVVVRVFVFEYFHGDQQPLHSLYWMIASLVTS